MNYFPNLGSDPKTPLGLTNVHKVGKIIEGMKNEDINDHEEETARDQFKQFNFSNVNKSSKLCSYFPYMYGWENILNAKYGALIDNSESKNGKKSLENRMKQMIKVGAIFLQVGTKLHRKKAPS